MNNFNAFLETHKGTVVANKLQEELLKTKQKDLTDIQAETQALDSAIYPQPSAPKSSHLAYRLAIENNEEVLRKENTITQLAYVIYFILFLGGIYGGFAIGLIEIETLKKAAIGGGIILVLALFSQKVFYQAYGDISMKIAKGAVGSVYSQCPAGCRKRL